MDKQKEIKEGMIATINFRGVLDTAESLADKLLSYLHDNDVVIKSNFTIWDRFSSQIPKSIKSHYKRCYVEPLI